MLVVLCISGCGWFSGLVQPITFIAIHIANRSILWQVGHSFFLLFFKSIPPSTACTTCFFPLCFYSPAFPVWAVAHPSCLTDCPERPTHCGRRRRRRRGAVQVGRPTAALPASHRRATLSPSSRASVFVESLLGFVVWCTATIDGSTGIASITTSFVPPPLMLMRWVFEFPPPFFLSCGPAFFGQYFSPQTCHLLCEDLIGIQSMMC